MDQRAIIITGSGRSGTYNLHEFLKKFSNYRAHHELNFDAMLKVGVLAHEGVNNCAETAQLMAPYLQCMNQKKSINVDVSNAALWCISELNNRHENIEWHMVVRNGYKVVSSFYYKFQKLMYPESKIELALSAFKNRDFHHPLDKTFWRPLPRTTNFYEKYAENLRFAIICWYWKSTLEQFEKNEKTFAGFYRFEDIVSGMKLEKFTENLRIDFSGKSMLNFFERPTNIENKINYKFTFEQRKIFDEICGEHMNRYYPDMDYYDVEY